jgi:hypothetical protein
MRGIAFLAAVAFALVGCASQVPTSPGPTPQVSASPSAAPSGIDPPPDGSPPAQPTPPAAPTDAPTVAPVALFEVDPPSTDPPTLSGTVGLEWRRARFDEYMIGSSLAARPNAWLYLLFSHGGTSAIPEVVLTKDFQSWVVTTPPIRAPGCGDGGSVAGSATAWLLRCGDLFRSADGRAWDRIELPEATSSELRHLVSDGQTFVGYRGEYPADDGVWVSDEGSVWRKIALPGAPFVRVDALIGRRGGGFVLAGRTAETRDLLREAHDMQWYSLPGEQALWTSADGATWTAIPVGAAFEGARITGLAADGPGDGLVAVGYFGENLENNVRQRVGVWRTTDMARWEHLNGAAFELLEPWTGQVRVVATNERWLLVGARLATAAGGESDLTPMGVTAGSDDGSSWWSIAPVELDPEPYGLNDLVATGNRVVVLGELARPGLEAGGPAVWVSPG